MARIDFTERVVRFVEGRIAKQLYLAELDNRQIAMPGYRVHWAGRVFVLGLGQINFLPSQKSRLRKALKKLRLSKEVVTRIGLPS